MLKSQKSSKHKERKKEREKKKERKKEKREKEGRKKEKGDFFFVEFGPEQKLPLDERRAPAATAPALCAAAPRRRRPGA